MDALIEFLQSTHAKIAMLAVAVLILWIFAQAIRWIINLFLIIAVIFVIIWKVPSVQAMFASFLH